MKQCVNKSHTQIYTS